jgi:hypothetical protein
MYDKVLCQYHTKGDIDFNVLVDDSLAQIKHIAGLQRSSDKVTVTPVCPSEMLLRCHGRVSGRDE